MELSGQDAATGDDNPLWTIGKILKASTLPIPLNVRWRFSGLARAVIAPNDPSEPADTSETFDGKVR